MVQRAGRPADSGRQRRPGPRRGLALVAALGLAALASPVAAAVTQGGTWAPPALVLVDPGSEAPRRIWAEVAWHGGPPRQALTLGDGQRVEVPGWSARQAALSAGWRPGPGLALAVGLRSLAAWVEAEAALAAGPTWKLAAAGRIGTGPELAFGPLLSVQSSSPGGWRLAGFATLQWAQADRGFRLESGRPPRPLAVNELAVRDRLLVPALGLGLGRGHAELLLAGGWRQVLSTRVLVEERPSRFEHRSGPFFQVGLRLVGVLREPGGPG